MLTRHDRAFPTAADIERHEEMEFLVSMRGESKRREAGFFDRDAEFFFCFADDRFFGTFARLHLAAGKFPEARHVLSFGPLRNEDTAIGIDERDSRNEEKRKIAQL